VHPPPYRYEISSIRKGRRSVVRLSLQVYRGRPVFDLRVFWRPPGSDNYLPTKRGVTMDAGRLPELVEALRLAAEAAVEWRAGDGAAPSGPPP
jgi:hypothetical protein